MKDKSFFFALIFSSHLVSSLLCMHNTDDPKKTEHLMALDGAKERLQLFKADLLEEGSFDPVIDGCHGVFHTASPVIISVADPRAELIDPAVKGTLNILKSCTRAPSVKRVIITSSIVAVLFAKKALTSDDLVDETYFSDPVLCENIKNWYALSKTLAENAAWKFAKENEIDMITIHPGFVIGPILQPTLNISMEVFLHLIKGKVWISFKPQTHILGSLKFFHVGFCSSAGKNPSNSNEYRMVDVRDVASAHIQAFEIPSASGRYIIDGEIITINEIEKIIREIYPDVRITPKNQEDPLFPVNYKLSTEKVKSLGLELTPVEASMRDTVRSLKEKGFL